jgi:hypothetical protein
VAKTLVFVGQSATFEAVTYGTSGEKMVYGKHFWNFGDGYGVETKVGAESKFTHTYFYPGDYTVSVEYFTNSYGEVPDASVQINIKVVSTDIMISNVGGEQDFFIELSNNTTYDTDISKWTLSGFNRLFSFPKNTILGAKKKIIFSSRITGFSSGDKDSLKLLDSEGQTVFDYGASLVPAQIVTPPKEHVASMPSVKTSVLATEFVEEEPRQEEVLMENITANAISSEGGEEVAQNSYAPIVGFSALLAVSAGAVYFIRRQKVASAPGEGFDILDE